MHTWLEARQREVAAAHRSAPSQAHHAFVTEGEVSPGVAPLTVNTVAQSAIEEVADHLLSHASRCGRQGQVRIEGSLQVPDSSAIMMAATMPP